MEHVLGMIVEYNPLHNGHHYHYHEGKELTGATSTVAVMSGHFLQRGEPALIDKWTRVQMALDMGVDLLLELPTAYATQNAERFAFGAISTLHALGVVDTVCFGSESGEIAWMIQLAEILLNEPDSFQLRLQAELKQGGNYPTAFSAALNQWAKEHRVSFDEHDWSQPNNRLGLYYCVALARLQSSITPCTIKRWKAGYHQQDVEDGRIASATALRQLANEARNPSEALTSLQPYIPNSTYQLLHERWLQGYPMITGESFYPQMISRLIATPSHELATYLDVSEGLEHRLKKSLVVADSLYSLIEGTKSKRYTWTRIQRALTHVLLGYTKEMASQFNSLAQVPYLRVLGMSERGQQLLQRAKKICATPIITNVSRERHPMLELDLQASLIYATALPSHLRKHALLREYQQPPLRPSWERETK
ncbi:nucleotidyltransferase [Rubeoparvulum massiliense]|uniref:nucleotidyltransferase n=1 Tax=Rubeoparvulum massiliense TaxID=1631346 RepID=UPI00065DC40E|nr:nucleotidyltransferase [Rubeoparvulum massiliense]